GAAVPEPRYLHNFDIDGDGDLDMVTYRAATDEIIYRENLGGGSYGPNVILASGYYDTIEIQSIDLDDDGDLDLIVMDRPTNTITKFINAGDGTFGPVETFMSGLFYLYGIEVKDLNNDGKMDVVCNQSNELTWIKNNGGGDFDFAANIPAHPENDCRYDMADMDGDGDLDVVFGNNKISDLFYSENLGDGIYSDPIIITNYSYKPIDSKIVDLDSDGDLDILISSYEDDKVFWYENVGHGEFSFQKEIATDLFHTRDVEAADFDGDGMLDVLAGAGGISSIGWYKNLGAGNFGPVNSISETCNDPYSMEAADTDLDGDMDVIALAYSLDEIYWFENLGGGIFADAVLIATGDSPLFIKCADVDNDGFKDLLYTFMIDDIIGWCKNMGDGTFGPEQTISSDSNGPNYLELGDLDNDGDQDLVASSFQDDKVVWFENLGDGTFGSETFIYLAEDNPRSIECADLNHDGKTDVIVTLSTEGRVVWFENLGGGLLADAALIADDLEGVMHASTGDLDGDGDLDIVACVMNSDQIIWFESLIETNHLVKGNIYVDLNENGMKDELESGVPFAQASCTPESFYSYTSGEGAYFIAYDTDEAGTYYVAPEELEYWGITSDSATYTVLIEGDSTLYENLDFGIFPNELVNELETSLASSFPRCNSTIPFWVTYSNVGSTIPSGIIHVELDDSLDYMYAEFPPDSIVDQNLYWSYSDLDYFESRTFFVTVQMPTVEMVGETLTSHLNVVIDSMGVTLFSIIDSLEQIVGCAVDPNDKTARPAGVGELGYIDPDTETIEYVIRFQNTGTDTAISVVIKDQLDANLDWITLSPLAWSHTMEIDVDHDGEVSFIFDNIMLADSNVNEFASHGFVKYKVDLLPGLPLETSIYNTAHIFFDANPAVITNTVTNTLHVDDDSGITENSENYITVYPNPFSETATVVFANQLTEQHTIIIYSILGTEVYRRTNITGKQIEIKQVDIGAGLYFLSVFNENNQQVYTVKLLAE
ncbi:MAG: putative repeat protein (TIGR01451 family), partial [Crocinitomix sp.]